MAYRGMWRWTDGVWFLSSLSKIGYIILCESKQGIACTIDDDFICLVKFVFTP